MKKIVFFLFLYTSIFLAGLFVFESLFLGSDDHSHIEDNYLEKSNPIEENADFNTPLTPEEKAAYKKILLEERAKIKQKIVQQEKKYDNETFSVGKTPEETKQEQIKYLISFFPLELKDKLEDEEDIVDWFLENEKIEAKLQFLGVELYEKINDVRGKFKDKSVKLFWVLSLPTGELFSVFIHEFWHYIDLYFLENTFTSDMSQDFYDISWDTTKVLKKWSKQGDFVSGYAMTNKYEDFAESFTYFVLHNDDFSQKAEKNAVLKKKYDFLSQKVFSETTFLDTNFSTDTKVKNYYRDITKIPYDLDKFLQYLQK